MKLCYYPLSPYSQKVLLGFYEKEVPFSAEVIPEFNPEVHTEYRKLHPLAKVPMLVTDEGQAVLESSVILEFIDQRFDTGTRLLPQDQDLCLQVRYLDRVFDQDLNGPLSTLFFAAMRKEGDTKEVTQARERLDRMYRFLDEHMSQRKWAAGDMFSLADCAALPPLSNAHRSHPFDAFPHLAAYVARMKERPSFLRVQAEAAPFVAKMRGPR